MGMEGVLQKRGLAQPWSYVLVIGSTTVGAVITGLGGSAYAGNVSLDSANDSALNPGGDSGSLSFDLPEAGMHRQVLAEPSHQEMTPSSHETGSVESTVDGNKVGSLTIGTTHQTAELSDGLSVASSLISSSKRLNIPAIGGNPPSGMTEGMPVVPDLPPPPSPVDVEFEALFIGGSDSLVAIAIGHAEGTRTQDGRKTFAYYGHVDPDSQVWTVGTFSYQHQVESPEEADQKQLTSLYRQATVLRNRATEQGILWDDETQLNAIDLAHQSPQAALGQDGFIKRLRQAYDMGMDQSAAIAWARTRSYLNPNTEQWNASDLSNTVQAIAADQTRRQRAIAAALAYHRHRRQSPELTGRTSPEPDHEQPDEGDRIDYLLSLDLDTI